MISVAMVNFNGGELVSRAVSAVLTSSLPVEVIVPDNGSSDGSLARLRAAFAGDERVTLLDNGANLGFAVASNRALEQARSDFLLLLNPDCLVAPDTLERMVTRLKEYPVAGMAGCRVLDPDGTEQAGCRRSLPTARSGFSRAFRLGRLFGGKGPPAIDLNQQPLPERPIFVEAVSGAFMLLRRAALDEVGALDEGYFMHCEDLDWCRRFADSGWKILFVPDVEVTHYQGSCSRNRPIRVEWHKHRGMMRYYRKFLQREGSIPLSLLVYAGIATRFTALALLSSVKRLMPTRK